LPQIKAYHIAFFLAPRINAAGRLGCAEMAVELLLTKERAVAERIAGELDRMNRERQAEEAEIMGEAMDMVEQGFSSEQRTIMLASPKWHTGIVGIVASRIVETYYRPTVLLVIDGETARGSGRSIRAFDLYGALTECTEFIEKFGGHKYAAGLTVRVDQIEPLRQRFEEVASSVLSDDMLVPEVRLDTWVEPGDISERLVDEFTRLEPCGCDNRRPLLGLGNAVATGPIRAMRNDSARFTLNCGDRTFSAVAFKMPELYDMLDARIEVDIAFLPEINVWRGQSEFRLLVRHVRPSRL
jgi:single-stranded-DNA-specific exonuclease